MNWPEDYINKIICGDCLEVMSWIPDKSIDFILSDYPFNCQDGKEDYFEFIFDTASEYLRISKDISNLLVVNNPHNIFKSSIYYQDDWTLINGIALIRKGSLRPAWHFGFQHNYCLVLNRGGISNKWNGTKINHDKDFLTDVIEYQNGYRGKGDSFHPQALPLELVKRFIEIFTNKGDLVLDPFVGSGTTAVACKQLGRNFIGIEFNHKYFEMANGRIAQEYLFT